MEDRKGEMELSARLSALQSVTNLLDWELQTGSLVGKSCMELGVTEQLDKLKREQLLGLGEEYRFRDGGIRRRRQKTAGSRTGEEKKLLKGIKGRLEVGSFVEIGNTIGIGNSGEAGFEEEGALKRVLETLRKQERRYTDRQAQEKARVTQEAGKAWQLAWQADKGDLPGEAEQHYLDFLQKQVDFVQAAKIDYQELLWDYEVCYSLTEIQDFFASCKSELAKLIKERIRKQRKAAPVWKPKESYDPKRQQQLARFLSEYLGFDYEAGKMGESAHPFTTAVNRNCVFWSNHYMADNPFAGIFTTLHETGHGLYEQNVAQKLAGSLLAGGCSGAFHEAIARFYENCIGRSEDFWKPIYGEVTKILGGEFETLPLEAFMYRIRFIEPGCIRTQADELTYPLHIILRFELEQEMLAGELPVKKLPQEWNRKMQEYVGVRPETPKEGYLQDIHWSSGQFGYFPAYQIGNAIAAQLYRHVCRILPIKEILQEGKLSILRDYLTTHIFRYGMQKDSDEILLKMTGEPLQFQFYMDYLKERYGENAIF